MHAQTTSPLWIEMRRLSPAFAALLLFSFVIALVSLTPTLFMLQMYERVMQSRSQTTLLFLSLIAAWMLLIWTALESIRVKVLQRAAVALHARISAKAFGAVARDGGKLDMTTRGAVLQDIQTLRDFLSGNLLVQLLDLCFAPIFIVVAFLFHPILGCVLLALVVVIVALTTLHQRLVRNAAQRAQAGASQAAELGRTVIGNAETIRVMGMLPALTGRWLARQNDMLGWQAAAAFRARVVGNLLRFLRHAQGPLMIGAGVLLFLDQRVGGGIIFAASVLSSRAIQPIDAVVSGWKAFAAVQTAGGRLDRALREAESDAQERFALPRPNGALVVSRATVTAPNGEAPLLNDVSFAVPPGRVVGVVGASGAGKSTLARLLVGAWRPRRGSVTLDGHELSHWDQDELGRFIGYVPQDVVLFPGTVAENIGRFGEGGEAGADAVLKAIAVAGVQDVIRALPDGLNTRLGPDGHALSGGQRQRIALARAVYGDPSLVVLDEPNSNLDALGEEQLAQAMARLREAGAIVILVTHRMNMIAHCDDVLVLHAGAVNAFGPREQILTRLGQPQGRQKLTVVGGAG